MTFSFDRKGLGSAVIMQKEFFDMHRVWLIPKGSRSLYQMAIPVCLVAAQICQQEQ